MKISSKGRYGLRALCELATSAQEEPLSIATIAGAQGLSERYLEQLMAKLKKAGIVESTRGAGGGYRIAKPLEDISVGDILRSLEGPNESASCEGLQEEGTCKQAEHCISRVVWQKINDSVNQTIDQMSLAQLIAEGTGESEHAP